MRAHYEHLLVQQDDGVLTITIHREGVAAFLQKRPTAFTGR